MNKLLLLPFLTILLFSCNNQKPSNGFSINGTITGYVPDKIFLEYENKVDTSEIKNNTFHFSGKTKDFSSAYIRISGVSAFANDRVYLENTKMDLSLNIEKRKHNSTEYYWISINDFKGTKTWEQRKSFEKFYDTIKDNKNKKELLFKKIESVISNSQNQNYGSDLFLDYFEKLDANQTLTLFNKIDTTQINTSRLENIKRRVFPSQELLVGSKIKDFSLLDTNGNFFSTKDIRNKIVLIDFWASWCAPCRKKFPELKRFYDKHKKNDFEILGVSIDTNESDWKKAIKKDSLQWINVIEKEDFDGQVASKYNIQAIPTTYLIDKEGTIIAKDISMDTLETYLLNIKNQ